MKSYIEKFCVEATHEKNYEEMKTLVSKADEFKQSVNEKQLILQGLEIAVNNLRRISTVNDNIILFFHYTHKSLKESAL